MLKSRIKAPLMSLCCDFAENLCLFNVTLRVIFSSCLRQLGIFFQFSDTFITNASNLYQVPLALENLIPPLKLFEKTKAFKRNKDLEWCCWSHVASSRSTL